MQPRRPLNTGKNDGTRFFAKYNSILGYYNMRLISILLFVFLLVPSSASAQSDAQRRASELSSAFRQAADRVLPATVKIISHVMTSEQKQSLQAQIPAFREPGNVRRPGDSMGTGVVIDSQGIVLTNNHVVARAKEIEVELPDGRRYYARKFRHDPETDLAVIWLNVPKDDKLPHAEFGDSDKMDIGDWVLAIGNPFDLDSTVSAGIISAKGRSLRQVQRTEFLQTDAAINPGNSGGPLINLDGEVIGINTAIASMTGANQGIGFALPANNAKWIAEQIQKNDKVTRAWIGVVTQPVTPWDVKRLNLSSGDGVRVDYPVPSSPAEDAGLQADDIILSFDGQPVNTVYHLQRLSERAEIGKNYQLVIVREGKRYAAEIETKAMPASSGAAASLLGDQVQSYVDDALGLLLMQATDSMTRRLRIGNRRGMLVVSSVPGGRGQKAGIQNMMLVVKIDGIPINSRQDYISARNSSSLSDGIKFDIIVPGGGERKIEVRLGQ